jgi:hypothetical protein
MGEETLSSETRESVHDYKNDTKDTVCQHLSIYYTTHLRPRVSTMPPALQNDCNFELTSKYPNVFYVFMFLCFYLQGKVNIPGASTLFVKFDPR